MFSKLRLRFSLMAVLCMLCLVLLAACGETATSTSGGAATTSASAATTAAGAATTSCKCSDYCGGRCSYHQLQVQRLLPRQPQPPPAQVQQRLARQPPPPAQAQHTTSAAAATTSASAATTTSGAATTAASGGSAGVPAIATCPDTAKGQTITMMSPLTGPDGDTMTALANRFNTENTQGIKVTHRPDPDYITKLGTMAASNTLPDMTVIRGEDITTQAARNILRPIPAAR